MKSYMKVTSFMALFFCIAFALSAADIEVDYLEGVLEVRESGSSWIEVDIGDGFADNATLRLSDRGYAELSSGGRRVTLTTDGTYQARTLFPQATTQVSSKSGLRGLLGSKFSGLTPSVGSYAGTTAGGVRGSFEEGESDDDFISWEDEEEDFLAEGKLLFAEGDFEGAFEKFEEGVLWESGAIQEECRFREALSLERLGKPREARLLMDKVAVESTDPFFGEYTVAMGTLLLESLEYDRAVEITEAYLIVAPKGEAAQAAHLLKAYGLLGQGNEGGYRTALTTAKNLDPSSSIGRAAAELLDS